MWAITYSTIHPSSCVCFRHSVSSHTMELNLVLAYFAPLLFISFLPFCNIQCLQKISHICAIFVDKPFFDAYIWPCKARHHYWPGFLTIILMWISILLIVTTMQSSHTMELNLCQNSNFSLQNSVLAIPMTLPFSPRNLVLAIRTTLTIQSLHNY